MKQTTVNLITATIVEDKENEFTGWVNEYKGVIAMGNSIEEVKKELIKVLSIKFRLESR